MPIYEYRCGSCGHTLDALQKVSDAPLSDCPACDESTLKRLISAPSFRLKGSGWYETDFKSDKDRKRNLAESAAGESAEKKGEDKSTTAEDKPKSKSEDPPKKKAEPKSSKGSGSEAA